MLDGVVPIGGDAAGTVAGVIVGAAAVIILKSLGTKDPELAESEQPALVNA